MPLYALDFSCVKFMTVFVCLCLCLWSWFFLCEVYVCVKPARPLLLFLFLSSYCVTVIFLMTGASRQSQAADATFPTFSLFQPFHFFRLLHFSLFQTFPLHAFYTFWREGKGEERRGEEACWRMGSKFFPLRTDFPPAGLRYNLSLFSDITHTHWFQSNLFDSTATKFPKQGWQIKLKMLTMLATAMLMKRMIVQANCYCWRGNSQELNDHRKSQLKIEMMMMIESLGHIF